MLTERELRRSQLLRTARSVGDDLERLLGKVRLAVSDFETHERHYQYSADLAYRIQHEILWGLANLGLDNLTTAATEYAKATDRGPEDEANDNN